MIEPVVCYRMQNQRTGANVQASVSKPLSGCIVAKYCSIPGILQILWFTSLAGPPDGFLKDLPVQDKISSWPYKNSLAKTDKCDTFLPSSDRKVFWHEFLHWIVQSIFQFVVNKNMTQQCQDIHWGSWLCNSVPQNRSKNILFVK